VTFDRPGYGRSPNQPGRSVADAARDAAAVADHLGLERFGVIGVSGGGPHAAACGALLSGRVPRLCICVGLGPVALDGFDPREGIAAETVREIELARRDEPALRRFVAQHHAAGLMSEGDPWLQVLPPSDRARLAEPDVAREDAADAAEWPAGGLEGWIEDDLAFFRRPWGFRAQDIPVPTRLLYGGADVLVPLSHGQAYARTIPDADLIVFPGRGHWLTEEVDDTLRWLADGLR
jgi:pimeloyl-ACP methyl ester carboxylesterase